MFCDQTHLNLTAGNGGNGCVSFRREKFISKGGPNGGDGGKGGDISFKVNNALNSLIHLDTYKQFSAEKGEMGKGRNKHGRNGEELVLEVPQGTLIRQIIRNEDGSVREKKPIADLSQENQRLLICKGGRGGYGNAHFVSSVRQAPKFAELGEEGEHIEVELELKLVADIGIIGIPSAGKSTLISVISNAKPKIADYHFTTLKPNLGVVQIEEKNTYIVADIPGLIEKAHEGKGLGHEFLRHTERCRLLVHLIDPLQPYLGSSDDSADLHPAVRNFQLINHELKAFSEELATKRQIIIINKSDVVDETIIDEIFTQLKELTANDERFTLYENPISAATHGGTDQLRYFLLQQLNTLKEEEQTEDLVELKEDPPQKDHAVYRPHLTNPKHFTITQLESESREDEEGNEYSLKCFRVNGERIEQIVNMTDFTNREARVRVQDVLKKMGIARELKKMGAEDGDQLCIGNNQFDFQTDW